MTQDGTQRFRSPLERNVWEAVTEFYDNNQNEVENLQERLTDYADLIPLSRARIRVGLEGLVRYLPPDKLEKLVKTKFEGPDEEKKRDPKQPRFRGYKGLVQKGVKALYDGSQSSFLKPEVEERRDWLIRYAALLDIIDDGNKLAETVFGFVSVVNNAVGYYYNIESERYSFFRRMGYSLEDGEGKPKVRERKIIHPLDIIVSSIGTSREALRTMKSNDPIAGNLVKEVLDHAYFVSEAVFGTFWGHATSLRDEKITDRNIDLREWEDTRMQIGRQIRHEIRHDGYLSRLSEPLKRFYLGGTTVIDLVSKPHT